MGMFDSVHVRCPKCGTFLEFQSKAGPCVLKDYALDSAPVEVLADIEHDSQWCDKCKHSVGIELKTEARLVTTASAKIKD